jgi:AraC-like DNA-binding protein
MNLQKMSSLINEPPHQVTETLNRLLGQRFSEYLNNFRVEEFKNLLKQPIYQKYSILALGMEVGFNSKATFNAAFKKFTQQTPSEYKAALTKQTQAK